MKALYNENDRYCCDWLSNLMDAGLITPGKIDDRSIHEVAPDDVAGFNRVHFFAGIGGWDYALNLAGWKESEVWTGSCPCQPFSLAGKQRGFADERHLWPVWYELIKERRPAKVFGEQVASASEWLRLVRGDLEALGYAVGAMPVQAASAGADHLRDRYWFVADAESGEDRRVLKPRLSTDLAAGGDVGNAESITERKSDTKADAIASGGEARPISCSSSNQFDWVIGADGKSRRVKSGIRLLAHGVPARVGKLRAFGNAIDPRPAAAFIQAASEVAP